MANLDDLQQQAAGDEVPVSVLIRRLKLLAARLDLPEVIAWCDKELSGYKTVEGLPLYRGPFDANVHGNFSGGFGAFMGDRPIPLVAFPSQLHDTLRPYFQLTFLDGVAEIEELARITEPSFGSAWPPNAIAVVQQMQQTGVAEIYPGCLYRCMEGRPQKCRGWGPRCCEKRRARLPDRFRTRESQSR